MNVSRGAEAYRRIEAQSCSPLELVVMLYDGALRFTSAARDAQVRGDVRARGEALSRVLAIVTELQNTLDLAAGGSVAAKLDRLYAYLIARIADVGAKEDRGAIDEIYRLLSTVRDGWARIASRTPTSRQP